MSYRNCEAMAFLGESHPLYYLRVVTTNSQGGRVLHPVKWIGILEELSGVNDSEEPVMRKVICLSIDDLGEDEGGTPIGDEDDYALEPL